MSLIQTALITALMSVYTVHAQSCVHTRTVTIPSGPEKKPIKVEIFEPQGNGPHPAVMMVHGADGIPKKWRKEYVDGAMDLAKLGCVVLLPHYFDRTGHAKVNKAQIQKHFFTWGSTLQDVLRYGKSLKNVRPSQVGILSYSLGSYLSLWLAARAANEQERVRVIVELYGGFPSEVVLVKPTELLRMNLKKMPPTLILHGEDDDVVNVAEAHKLEKLLKDNMVLCEKKTYPRQKHVLTGPAADDAWKRAMLFFTAHLKALKK